MKDKEHKERVELEQKRKEEEAQVEQLEVAAHKKVNAVAQALLEGHTGCDLCLQLGELISPFVAVHVFECLSDCLEYECSHAKDSPGAACVACQKIKKKCEWSSESLPGPLQAGSSKTVVPKAPSSKVTAAPLTPTASKW